jgi:hypothetical protein
VLGLVGGAVYLWMRPAAANDAPAILVVEPVSAAKGSALAG